MLAQPPSQSRCHFSGEYHDKVWGTSVTDSKGLFAQLSLATQQCGVSWKIVWNKREHYAIAFHNWDMSRVALMTNADLDVLCDPHGPWSGKLIQNRRKLAAIIHNARQCQLIEEGHQGGLVSFLWQVVLVPHTECATERFMIPGLDRLHNPVAINHLNSESSKANEKVSGHFGVTSEFSDRLASILKRTGEHKSIKPDYEPFTFLGSVTLQAFMLQNGLLNGHSVTCSKNPRASCYAESPKRKREEAFAPRTLRSVRKVISRKLHPKTNVSIDNRK